MKIKIGFKVYDSEEHAVMVVLSDKDKENIANMDADATRYAVFPDTDPSTVEDRLAWMRQGT